ncbi:SGNH/GDSL hydrolase family protein [Spirillospora sp. CA-253888]
MPERRPSDDRKTGAIPAARHPAALPGGCGRIPHRRVVRSRPRRLPRTARRLRPPGPTGRRGTARAAGLRRRGGPAALAGVSHVVAIGESTTADRLSWFEILRHAVALRRPDDAVRFTNLAVPGCTTTQALAQVPALRFQRPDLVFCMLGGNDAQRLAPDAPTLVGLAETERNLGLLHGLAQGLLQEPTHKAAQEAAQQLGPVPWVWITPSPVDEARVAAYPHFQRAGIGWSNKDIDAIADHLLNRPEATVDARPAVSAPKHLQEDGVHLTIAGQSEIAAAVVHAMAGSS